VSSTRRAHRPAEPRAHARRALEREKLLEMLARPPRRLHRRREPPDAPPAASIDERAETIVRRDVRPELPGKTHLLVIGRVLPPRRRWRRAARSSRPRAASSPRSCDLPRSSPGRADNDFVYARGAEAGEAGQAQKGLARTTSAHRARRLAGRTGGVQEIDAKGALAFSSARRGEDGRRRGEKELAPTSATRRSRTTSSRDDDRPR